METIPSQTNQFLPDLGELYDPTPKLAYSHKLPRKSQTYLHLKLCQKIDFIEIELPDDGTVLKCAADTFSISLIDLTGSSRIRQIVDARRVVMNWFYSNKGYSLYRIGEMFLGRNGKTKDHATVLSMIRSFSSLIDSDRYIQEMTKKFCDSLKSKNPKYPTKMLRYSANKYDKRQ